MSTKRLSTRRRLVVAAVSASLVASLGITAVLAVHDEDFQLDGDVLSSTTTSAGGTTQGVDWDAIFNANGTTKSTLPTGFADAKLTKDFNNNGATFLTSDTSTFATGSKDTLPIADWQCNFDNNVNSKIDVMNAYSTSYQIGTGDEFMYFALERNTNTGDANVGFWFLQDEVGCTSTGGAVDFVGEHRDGDILVVSEFSNGGAVSTIQVYRWDDPDPTDDDPGSLNPDAIGEGVDCRSTTTLPDDSACAAANTTANGVNGTITVPWLTSNFKDKVGNKLRTAEFFEGGVNLTDLNLGGKCFNTFIGDTRSSTSLTATLFDFALGVTGSCTSTTVTTPKYDDGDSFENIPAAGISIGTAARVNVRDSALLTVDGVDSYAGDVTFSLCGPLALTSTSNCQTGGVQIGSPVNVAGTSPETVLGPIATLTSAGRYCWRAEYSGDADAGVPPSSDPSAGPPPDTTSVTECFKVNPVQPTLSTQATRPTPVDFGQSISDKIYLSGTAKQPGTDGVGPGGTINATAGYAGSRQQQPSRSPRSAPTVARPSPSRRSASPSVATGPSRCSTADQGASRNSRRALRASTSMSPRTKAMIPTPLGSLPPRAAASQPMRR